MEKRLTHELAKRSRYWSLPQELAGIAVVSAFNWYWLADVLPATPRLAIMYSRTLGCSSIRKPCP